MAGGFQSGGVKMLQHAWVRNLKFSSVTALIKVLRWDP